MAGNVANRVLIYKKVVTSNLHSHDSYMQTFTAMIRTCKGMIALIRYLFACYSQLDFILLGKICSDYLEVNLDGIGSFVDITPTIQLLSFSKLRKLFV